MQLLPRFTEDGLLPPGDYPLRLRELMESPLVVGGPDLPVWDSAWRRRLVENLSIMVNQLWQVGILDIFIDGSFVEEKAHPNDIDGYFCCDRQQFYDGQLESGLQALDPVWTWDPDRRYALSGQTKRQLPMWHKYRVELFPHVDQFTGIRDQFGRELTFPSAFRQSRGFKPKGIVKIEGES